ncbi:IS1 ORF2 [Shigella sonnei]|nr:IS1 ORF2 [Shigella sonnei]
MTLSCSSTDFENDSDFRPSRARCCLRFRLCRSIRCVYRLLITCSFPFRRDSYSGQPSVIHITTSKGDSRLIRRPSVAIVRSPNTCATTVFRGYVGAKSRQRWLFYAYDSLRKTVVAHVFGERTMATLGRLMSLLSPFDVVIWMTDGWPLYESRLKGKLHVISKRYTQRIERHNLNLRQHLARLGRKSLSFSKSVELHDKVIGHYLNIKHYQ